MGDRPIEPEPIRDRSHVQWFAERLRRWEGLPQVADWMPHGFGRYARLLHPAYEREANRPVPWSRVAEWSGRELHPTVLFEDVAIRADGERWSTMGAGPQEGRPGRWIVSRLAELLADHTSTPESSWYAVWYGYGGLDRFEDRAVEINPRISSSGRRYLLFHVGVREAVDLGIPSVSRPLVLHRWWMRLVPRLLWQPVELRAAFHSPSFWWPEDRTWFVSTEVDSRSTYIGGSAALIERLLADPELEVLPATLDDPFDGVHPGMRPSE